MLVRHAAEIAPIIFHNEPLEGQALIIVPFEAAKEIIEGLGLFLIAICTKLVLDPVKFGVLCLSFSNKVFKASNNCDFFFSDTSFLVRYQRFQLNFFCSLCNLLARSGAAPSENFKKKFDFSF